MQPKEESRGFGLSHINDLGSNAPDLRVSKTHQKEVSGFLLSICNKTQKSGNGASFSFVLHIFNLATLLAQLLLNLREGV